MDYMVKVQKSFLIECFYCVDNNSMMPYYIMCHIIDHKPFIVANYCNIPSSNESLSPIYETDFLYFCCARDAHLISTEIPLSTLAIYLTQLLRMSFYTRGKRRTYKHYNNEWSNNEMMQQISNVKTNFVDGGRDGVGSFRGFARVTEWLNVMLQWRRDCCHDWSFKDDVNFGKKNRTRRRFCITCRPRWQECLKTGVESEWFNTKQIFHWYSIHGIMHDRQLAYMHACHWAIINCIQCHITPNNNNMKCTFVHWNMVESVRLLFEGYMFESFFWTFCNT